MLRRFVPLLLLLAAACGPSASYEPAVLSERFEALRPALEAALGEEFGAAPEFVTGTEEELVEIITKESTWFQSRVKGGPRGLGLSVQNRQIAKQVVKAMLAKLDIETGRVVVNPAAFRFLSELAPELRPVRGSAFRDYVLLHEAVHVWQHRRFGVSKFVGQPATVEEILCRQAVLEGHAQHIAGKAAAELGLSAEYRRLEALNSEVPSSVEDPGARMIIQAVSSIFSFQYVEGRKFVEAIFAEDGPDKGVARIFREPPCTARQVARPAEYLAGGGAGEELRKMVGEIGRLLTKSGGRARSVTMTSAMLRQSLSFLGEAVPAGALDGYVDGVVVVTTKGLLSPEPQFIVAVLEFETEAAAMRFMDVERAVDAAKNEAFSAPGGDFHVRDAESRDLRWENRDAFYSAKYMSSPDGSIVRMRNFVFPSGKRVVEFSAQGEGFAPEELQKLSSKILGVLENGE